MPMLHPRVGGAAAGARHLPCRTGNAGRAGLLQARLAPGCLVPDRRESIVPARLTPPLAGPELVLPALHRVSTSGAGTGTRSRADRAPLGARGSVLQG